jgi:hypothetical protein
MKPKILITGMTAQQYSPAVATRSLSFAGILTQVFMKLGYDVDFTEPSTAWDDVILSQYSHVLVGIAPPLSVTANGTYGALSIISRLSGSDKLTLFIDAPEPWKIFANIRAIEKNDHTLFKSFYAKRKGYKTVTESSSERDRVVQAITSLGTSQWPTTLFPALPWNGNASEFAGVPENAARSMTAVYVDSLLVSNDTNFNSARTKRWVVENDSTKWTKDTLQTLATPSLSTREHKIRTSDDLYNAMSSSTGALVGPHGDKMTWWSIAFSHALNASTPIATDWRASRVIGNAWDHLASGIDEMTPIDQYELAVTQKIQYIQSLLKQKDITIQLQELVRS